MQRDNGQSGSRSLLERMSSPRNGHFIKDDVQARIDSITAQSPDMAMMMGGAPPGFPMNGIPPMDMAAMANMTNPLMLQEMMMNQMALMTQMAGAMGILNPAAMGMNGPFPMQPGMGPDMNMVNGMNGGQQGMDGRGRGRGRGGMRGGGRGRGGHTPVSSSSTPAPDGSASSLPGLSVSAEQGFAVAAPTPVHAVPPVVPQIAPSTSQDRSGLVPPERPQSPTLCKYGLKCTNPVCRYSHPSPVATPESGVVLSNEACENGKNCKDKDCIKAHVSPAALKASGELIFTPFQ
jgi:nuclear polyadenylated RNA-binding protein NAB2